MLRVTAPATEIARLGEVLRALVREDADGFDALFEPSSPQLTVSGVAPAVASELRAFGLVDGGDDALEGQHRIRRVGERFYVLELGGTLEYVQDVWPETDALLAEIASATPGGLRVADVGTGSGVLAIEAAARGHHVVATDLYDTALQLARFNAILNGVDVELRRGHLFEPLPSGAFDLVVTAPHYGREADQLRLEVLADGPRVLAHGGRLILASQLEWQGEGPLAVEPLLRAIAGRGMSVRVAPIDSALKRHWHLRAIGDDARLVSRWRFTVAIANDGRGELAVARPAVDTLPTRVHLPLARLREAPRDAAWTIANGDDVVALSALLAALAQHELTIDAQLPALVLDACRFGARPCVAPRGQAAGAILDGDGNVRPCTHGEPLARGDDSLATLLAKQQAAAAGAYARRGCRECAIVASCPRCLFAAPFADEAAYCAFMRANAATLPRFRRLVETLARLARRGGEPPVRVRMWPRPDRALAQGASLVDAVAAAWHAADAWLVELGGTHHLFWLRDGSLHDAELDAISALVGGAAADGERAPLPERVIERGARRLAGLVL